MIAPNLKDKGILLVDDEESLLQTLSAELKDQGFTSVHTASDGIECISLLDQLSDQVYVILLDLRMPKMDGFDVMRHLVNVHKPIVGIVVLTGFANSKSEEIFFSLGTETIIASRFMSKPYYFEDIVKEVEKTLNLVNIKRSAQQLTLTGDALGRLSSIDRRLVDIELKLSKISSRVPSFFGQLGLDIVRAVLIGIFVIITLYLGLSNILIDILKKLH